MDEIEQAAALIKKIEGKKKLEKLIISLGILIITVLIFIILLSFLNQVTKKVEDFGSIRSIGRDADMDEKKLLFTYLIEITEDKVIDKEKYSIILQDAVSIRKNGKIYIATGLTPYTAIKLAETYKTAGIINDDGIRILAPRLKLNEEDAKN